MVVEAKQPRNGLPVGPNRGFKTTPRAYWKIQKPHKLSSRGQLVKEVIREVAGFAPYERRIMELLKVGTASTSKRAMKMAKKRLGTHKRGKSKRDQLLDALAAQRKRQQQSAHH